MKKIVALLLFAVSFGVLAQANFVVPQDVPQRFPTFIRPAASYVDARALAANVAEVWTAPASTRYVIFASTCNFYAKPNAAATVPGDTTDGTASTLNPTAWYFNVPVTTIGVIAAETCIVTIEAYRGPVN